VSNRYFTYAGTVIAIGLALAPFSAFSQANVDEALQGFDEPAAAPPSPELDDALSGFDEASATEPASTARPSAAPWRLGGDALLSAAYNYAKEAPAPGTTDHRGLSRLRARLNLRLDGDLAPGWETRLSVYGFHDFAYALQGRDEFTDAVIAELEDEAELNEAWVRAKLTPQLDIKVGRQVVVWGKSDNVRVTDVLNPLDNREPGLTDIEDLRLPVTMTRVDYYLGDWNLSALALHEVRFNKNPPFGSEFYAMPSAPPDEVKPGAPEYGLALNGIFSGWDLSFYAAGIYDDQSHLVTTTSGPEARHSRVTMLGAASNMALGNWLVKGEIARFAGLEFRSLPGEEKARTDLLLGMEYSGFSDTTLSVEVVDRYLEDFEAALKAEGAREHDIQTALRYTGDFLHARLHLTAVAAVFEGDGGGFSRWQAKYDLRDALSLTGGVLLFHDGDKFPFAAYSDNDRVFGEIKYSF
jgi:hypothetical protein